MITELAVERVEFTCGQCQDRWTVDYDVQRFMDGFGHEWEYFSCDNRSVPSPYSADSAPACGRCGHRPAGRLAARRPVPLPGMPGSPRSPVPDAGGHRPERHSAPMLSAAADPQGATP